MLDLVVIDGRARGIVTRNLVTGAIESHAADAVVLGTGGYGNVYYLSTNAKGSNCTAIWRAYKRGAAVRQSLLHADSSHLHSGFRRLSIEADADERIAAQRRPHLGAARRRATSARRARFPKPSATIIWSAAIRASAIWCRATWLRATPKRCATKAAAWASTASACTWISPTPSSAWARHTIDERYGNLFEMYERITGEDPYKAPMRIYPAIHYTMGGLWVDYHLMSTIPGLFVIGEANFSDHGANRLGASALMQGLSDGYFILPYTIGDYLASAKLDEIAPDEEHFIAARDARRAAHHDAC